MASSMSASFGVELKKMYKRPATWFVTLIFLALIVLFGYLLSYIFFSTQGDSSQGSQQFLNTLYPKNLVSSVLGLFGNFGTALALVLGTLCVGSEYGWQTMKLILTQRPGRSTFFTGKFLAVGAILVVMTLLSFVVAAISSYVVATLQNAPTSFPGFLEILKGLGAGVLILATFAAMGIFLATLFRSNALALTIGLVYLLVLENLFLGFGTQSKTVANIGKALPARNSLDLATSFGGSSQATANTPPGIQPIDPTQAVLVLLAYTVVFLILSLLLFRSRDVI